MNEWMNECMYAHGLASLSCFVNVEDTDIKCSDHLITTGETHTDSWNQQGVRFEQTYDTYTTN